MILLTCLMGQKGISSEQAFRQDVVLEGYTVDYGQRVASYLSMALNGGGWSLDRAEHCPIICPIPVSEGLL